MIRAALLSRNTKLDEKGKIVTTLQPENIINFDVANDHWVIKKRYRICSTLQHKLAEVGILFKPIEIQEFERPLKNKDLVQNILNDVDLSPWVDKLAKTVATDPTNINVVLSEIPSLSATHFTAGRASLFTNNIGKLIATNYSEHFAPDMLHALIHQDYNFNTYFLKKKLENEYKIRDLTILWEKRVENDEIYHVPMMKTPDSDNWKPVHFTEMRTKMIEHLPTIDKNMEELIIKQAVLVHGRKTDPKVLKYALLIQQIHVVLETRFEPISKKSKLRIRPCLDAWILNDVTETIPFRMITGADLTCILDQVQTWMSFDNKTSYYNCFLSPRSRQYLCFVWRDLICSFTVPVFGITNAPTTNECFMAMFHAELRRVLKKHLLEDWIMVLTTWIDDTAIGTKNGIQSKSRFNPITPIIALIFIQLGITVNIQKSCFTNSNAIEYLGLKLVANPGKAHFQVRDKMVDDLKLLLLNVYEDTQSMTDILMTSNFEKDRLVDKDLSTQQLLLNFNLSFKIVEKAMGKMLWINRNNQVDTLMFCLIILYRNVKAWKNTFLVEQAKIELLNLPHLIFRQINIPQCPTPLYLNYYLSINWIFGEFVQPNNAWDDLPPFDISKLLADKMINNKHRFWFKDGKLWQTWKKELQAEVSELTLNLPNTATDYSDLLSGHRKGLVCVNIRIIDTWLLNKSELITETQIRQMHALSFIKKKVWDQMGLILKFTFHREPPKSAPKEVSYIQPHYSVLSSLKMLPSKTVILFQNEIPHEDILNLRGWSISWKNPSSIGSHYCSFNHATFWEQCPDDVSTVIFNAESRKLTNLLVQIASVRPPNISIIWPIREKKYTRLVIKATVLQNVIQMNTPGSAWLFYQAKKWAPFKRSKFTTLIFPAAITHPSTPDDSSTAPTHN